MATEKRTAPSSLIEHLFEETPRYNFFSAVHLLESLSPNKKGLGSTLEPGREPVRFSVDPGFSFPASDISELIPGEEAEAALMKVAFLGLIGPAGILPNWYNELAVDRRRAKDTTLTAFLDLFHHRLISLFYLAWKKHQFPVNFQPGAHDRLSGYLLSLCGLGTRGLTGRIGFAEESLNFYSGLLSRTVPSASAISDTVAHFTNAEARVEQFLQRLIPLEPEELSPLGRGNATLGGDSILGTHVWECETTFRVVIGPLGFAQFQRLIPSGDLHRPTFALIRTMVGIEYEFALRLMLRREEVPGCRLGRTANQPETRLGWSTWLKGEQFRHDTDMAVTFQE